ncbi:galactonate dehydratase [Psychromarinibacter sp. C21-152]|uniref:Galactonate dehydratase n=1 Tax=Psychromarinibacter sediminicola TaxID=3033385 RepID=A0AAE3NWK5_9RHOB|nr:galactonate dehydratase [Psychromarinibacter sediminicola]MDF0603346.1 galactonate dehydratase [Psychromarinibacter sediminicola]
MKITSLETFLVPPRWLFLKIETDAGISGWGEPVLEGRAETLAALIGELSDFLVGQDPRHINDIWQMLYRNGGYRGGPVLMSAISGIDHALWDILGQVHGVPAYALLGGAVRSRVRAYTWVGGDRPSDLVTHAKRAMASGFSAVKLNVCSELAIVESHRAIDEIVARLGELRSAVGNELDLAFDFHGRVHAPMARILLKELEPLRPLFVEDPVAADHVEALAELSQSTSIPLAVGERMHTRGEFRALLESRGAQIINPDPSHMGGITETIRLGAFAESYDVALAPHCPLGPIALAGCLQIDAVCHNAFIQEQSLGMHYNQESDLLDCVTEDTRLICENGNIEIPTRPGLGITIDEDQVRKLAETGHRWHAPVWRHVDGSIAEW